MHPRFEQSLGFADLRVVRGGYPVVVEVVGVSRQQPQEDLLERLELALLLEVVDVEPEHAVAALQHLARQNLGSRARLGPRHVLVLLDRGGERLRQRTPQLVHAGRARVGAHVQRHAVLRGAKLGGAGGDALRNDFRQHGLDNRLAGRLAADLPEADDVVLLVDLEERTRLLQVGEHLPRKFLQLGIADVERLAERGRGPHHVAELVERLEAHPALARKRVRAVDGVLLRTRSRERQGVGCVVVHQAGHLREKGEDSPPTAGARIGELVDELRDVLPQRQRDGGHRRPGRRYVAQLHDLVPECGQSLLGLRNVLPLGVAQDEGRKPSRRLPRRDVVQQLEVVVDFLGEFSGREGHLVGVELVKEGLELVAQHLTDALAEIRAVGHALRHRLAEPLHGGAHIVEEFLLRLNRPVIRQREHPVGGRRERGHQLGHRGVLLCVLHRRQVHGCSGDHRAAGNDLRLRVLREGLEREFRELRVGKAGAQPDAVFERRLGRHRVQQPPDAVGERLHRVVHLLDGVLRDLAREEEVGLEFRQELRGLGGKAVQGVRDGGALRLREFLGNLGETPLDLVQRRREVVGQLDVGVHPRVATRLQLVEGGGEIRFIFRGHLLQPTRPLSELPQRIDQAVDGGLRRIADRREGICAKRAALFVDAAGNRHQHRRPLRRQRVDPLRELSPALVLLDLVRERGVRLHARERLHAALALRRDLERERRRQLSFGIEGDLHEHVAVGVPRHPAVAAAGVDADVLKWNACKVRHAVRKLVERRRQRALDRHRLDAVAAAELVNRAVQRPGKAAFRLFLEGLLPRAVVKRHLDVGTVVHLLDEGGGDGCGADLRGWLPPEEDPAVKSVGAERELFR